MTLSDPIQLRQTLSVVIGKCQPMMPVGPFWNNLLMGRLQCLLSPSSPEKVPSHLGALTTPPGEPVAGCSSGGWATSPRDQEVWALPCPLPLNPPSRHPVPLGTETSPWTRPGWAMTSSKHTTSLQGYFRFDRSKGWGLDLILFEVSGG